MNKPTFDAMLAQYEVKEASGAGEVSWESGVHCEIPEVVISGKAEQTWYEGRNLFDISKIKTQSESANTWISEVGENYIVISESETHTGNGYCNSGMSLLELAPSLEVGNTYVLSLTTDSKIDGIYTPLLSVWHNGETRTITEDNLTEKIVFYGLNVSGGQTPGPNKISNIQIEKGTVTTSYEPYVGGIPAPNPWYPIEPVFSTNTKLLVRGKNLIRSDNLQYGYEINGGGRGRDIFPHLDKASCISWYIPVKPNTTYTIGYNNKNLWCSRLCETDQYKICTSNWAWYAWGDVGSPAVITTEPDTSHISLTFVLRDTSLEMTQSFIDEAKLWIYEGDVGDYGYIPYFDGGEADAPELLSILNEYQDFWNPQTGIKEKVIEALSFSGEENWYSYNNTSVALGHWADNKDEQASYNEPIGYICTHAIQGNNGNPDQNDYTFVTHCDKFSNNNWIVFHCNMSLQEWKDFLASEYSKGTPVTVWYVLAEPEIIQTTPQPLTQPKGPCEIIQTEGTIPGCPISAKYLAHK